jgi:hypothetical protein
LIDRAMMAILTLNPADSATNSDNLRKRHEAAIGIGGVVAHSPLPHHRTCGSAYGGSVRLS